MLSFHDLANTVQLFTWVDPDSGEELHFAIEPLLADARVQAIPPEPFYLDPVFARYALLNRGVELFQLNHWRMAFKRPGFEAKPVVFADMADNTKNLIDGQHRYCAAFLEGRKELLGIFVPEAIWREYLVDIPDEFNAKIRKSMGRG